MKFGAAAPGPLPFIIDSQPFTLTVPDGRTLAGIAAVGQWPCLVPGLLADDDRAKVETRLRDPNDRLGLYACWRISLGLAPELYGVEWWAAQRLCGLAQERWRDWSAWCIHHGLDIDTASGHRLVSAMWAWIIDGIQEEKDLARAEKEIFNPPPQLRHIHTVVPPGFSESELAEQARQLGAYRGDYD